MGKQGKGIIGGFSGKVGSIVGYNRNGKDIIQSKSTRKSVPNNLTPTFNLLNMVAEALAVVGLGTCEHGPGPASRNQTASGELSLKNKVGGYKWVKSGADARYFINFSNEYQGTQEVNYELTIISRDFDTRISINNVVVTTMSEQLVGEQFGVIYSSGELWFYRDNGTGQLVKTFQIIGYPLSELFIVFTMFGVNTECSEIEIGLAEGVFEIK